MFNNLYNKKLSKVIKDYFGSKILRQSLKKPSRQSAAALMLAVFILAAFSILGLTAVSLLTQQTTSYVDSLNNIKSYYLAMAARNFAYEYYLPFRYNFADVNDGLAFGKRLSTGTFSMTFSSKAGGSEPRSIRMQFTGSGPNNFVLNLYQDFAMDGSFGLAVPTLFRDLGRYVLYIGELGDVELCKSTNGIPARFFGDVFIDSRFGTVQLTSNTEVGSSANPRNIFTRGNLEVSTDRFKNCGDLILTKPVEGVWGNAYANGTITEGNPICIKGDPVYPNHIPPPPADGWPADVAPINNIYFSQLLLFAALNGLTGPVTLESRNLNGENIFVNGNVTIATNSTINGPGNIIANGDITVSSRTSIGEGVGLISENNIYIEGGGIASPYTVLGGTWDLTNRIIEGDGVLIYANEYSNKSPALGSAIKGTLLINGPITAGQEPDDQILLFGLFYTNNYDSPSILFNDHYGNFFAVSTNSEFSPITTPFGDIFRYQAIPYPSGSREEIPLEIKGLYRMPRSALRIVSN